MQNENNYIFCNKCKLNYVWRQSKKKSVMFTYYFIFIASVIYYSTFIASFVLLYLHKQELSRTDILLDIIIVIYVKLRQNW